VRRPRLASGFDAVSAALIVGGAALVAASIVAAVVLLSPPRSPEPAAPEPTPTPLLTGRTSAALPPDRVATVLTVDAAAGAAGAARMGDHIDILGFFSRQASGTDPVTRVLLADVPVLSVDRSGTSVALTLAVPQESALLLNEAQALGAQPLVALRPLHPVGEPPASFSDADLAKRLTVGAR
jgi:Flp pilus assembly protein CpaB